MQNDDIIQVLENGAFIKNYILTTTNTLNTYKENLKQMKNKDIGFMNEFNLSLSQSDFELMIFRLENRTEGLSKMKYFFDHNDNKASPYKLYFLNSLAEHEHWYKTAIDSEYSVSNTQYHLTEIESLINSVGLDPDEESWSKLRKKIPELFFDINRHLQQAKNSLDYHLDLDVSFDNKTRWIFARTCELYNSVEFENDHVPISEPKSPVVNIHPTDTFIRRNIKQEDWNQRILHKNILTEYVDEIRTMAEMRTARHTKIKKRMESKPKTNKP
jgi:hypothetical protein